MNEKAFNNLSHNKLHLTFPNGNCISTIWGFGAYADNYDVGENDVEPIDYIKIFRTFRKSNTVEIMLIKCPNKLSKQIHKKFNGDGQIIGHLSIKNWLWIINKLSK